MFGVCIADIFQLIANGLFILLGLLNFDLSEDFEKVGFLDYVSVGRWYKRCKLEYSVLFTITIGFESLHVICVGIVCVFVSPYCGIHFTRKFYWSYANQYPWTETVRDIEYKST
uniref:Odorant receptor n=1 Tax=Meloidogyne javanica TaxID=6303 RepID=A0A915M691_MELJA